MQSSTHKLAVNHSIPLTLGAGELYSAQRLLVEVGEEYRAWCDKGQWWVDMIIPASPAGYPNPLANLFGQRLKGARCFCLCAALNEDDRTAFAIGKDKTFTIDQDGSLAFFANDVRGFEWNNWGSIQVNIERTK